MESARRWLARAVVLLVAGGSSRTAHADVADAPPLADDSTLIALAVALSCADAPDGAAGPRDRVAQATDAEVELVATVRARTLRFDEVPNADALLRAAGGARAVWRAERVNLPARPQPGVVYRDVRVRLTIASDADGLAAMLREAKKAARGIRVEDPAPAPVDAPGVVEGTPAPPPEPLPVVAPVPVQTTTPPPTATATATANLALPPPPPPPQIADQAPSAPPR